MKALISVIRELIQMGIVKLIGLAIALFMALGIMHTAYEISYRLIYGKASYSTEAVYKVPHTNVEIVLERRCIHLFLAEYERTLVLRANGKELLRKEVAADTGGYCRMNVYKISPTEYFLRGDLSHDKYKLDISHLEINSMSSDEKPANAKFVGVFDSGEERSWRFIAASERIEQSNKIEKYKEYR